MKSKRHLLVLLVGVGLVLGIKWPSVQRLYYGVDHVDVVLQEAERNHLSPHLVAAVISTESGFREQAQSDVGALGLMQLMPETAKDMAGLDGITIAENTTLFDPEINIRLGTLYLATLRKEFPKEDEMLAAYNAGPATVAEWRQRQVGIEYQETKLYVQNVQKRRDIFKTLYPEWAKP